jgi:glycine betaine/proline transport system permease protein
LTAIPLAIRSRPEIALTRGVQLAILVVAAAVLYLAFQGRWTLEHHDDAPLFLTLNGVRDWVDANRTVNPVFLYVLEPIRNGIDWLDEALTFVFAHVNWIGLTAIVAALGLAFVTWRTALLVVGSMLAIGLLGLWTETVQTVVLIGNAVALSLLIGIPLGIVAGRSDRFLKAVTPVLDFMQIMPTFAYLAPLTLIFLIGPPAAVIATMIYSIPPAIRITALGIRGVPPTTVEAATSLGATDGQVLSKVQLPMARGTIGLAVNQTIMMALSIIVVAALINAPGLGESIIVAIQKLKVGAAVQAGAAIVLLATILDRITAGANKRTANRALGPAAIDPHRRRRILLASAGLAVGGIVVGVVVGATTAFPSAWRVSFTKPIDDITRWIEINANPITDGAKNIVSAGLLDPLQTVLTTSPWWLVVAVAAGIAMITTGRRAAITVAVALVLIVLLQVWQHAMETLTMVIVAVVLTMLIGIAMGVWAARSRVVSAVLRPINDAAQTLPSFVYLVPAVALFGATRFTAILAAVIYAVPAVIRLVEDGVRGVSPTAVEAATSAGASSLQTILKVQLPMARRSLLVAVNQGVVLVLAMVVIGGLVGAQALGFDVVSGFSQHSFFGRGMAAAIGIVLLGVMLDRITQGAGARRPVRGIVGRLGVGLNTNRPIREAP